MRRIVLIVGLTLSAGTAFAHGGAGGGGGGRVKAWQQAHPAICEQNGGKLILIADPSKTCPDQ